MRTQTSIAISVRIALRQSQRGLSGDDLARKLNLRGSFDLILALGQLKAAGLIVEQGGHFYIGKSEKEAS